MQEMREKTMFQDRIKQAENEVVPVVDLRDGEKDLYRGASNLVVATIEGDAITHLEYLTDWPEDADLVGYFNHLLEDGEHWLGWTGSYQFGEPRRIDGGDPAIFARVLRLFEENWDF